MDALAGLLDGPRAHQAFLLRLVMAPPWSIWVDDRAPLSLVALLRGQATFAHPDQPPQHLAAGDIALVRWSGPYAFADPPGTPPQVFALPGGECTMSHGEDVGAALGQGVRTLGNDPDGGTEVLIGAYEHVSELGQRLLTALPPLVVVPASALESPLLDVLRDEIPRDEPGQQVVLDRLLDLLVVSVLRTWFARSGDDAPGWFRATTDPIVGPALRLIQADPARSWTVADLATTVGCSRATLARRFTDLVGEPPMAFLTERRLALAADLLLQPGVTVGSVARDVGYASPFAFSAAFKRTHGHSPRQHQQLAAALS